MRKIEKIAWLSFPCGDVRYMLTGSVDGHWQEAKHEEATGVSAVDRGGKGW